MKLTAEMDRADKKLKKEHKHRQHNRKDDRKQSSSLSSSSSSPSLNIIASSSSDHLRGNHLVHHVDSGAGNSDTSVMDELRQRRLQREKQERKRANVLLANVDIFGAAPQRSSSAVDAAENASYQYHQQFHPHLLKDKKHFAFTRR